MDMGGNAAAEVCFCDARGGNIYLYLQTTSLVRKRFTHGLQLQHCVGIRHFRRVVARNTKHASAPWFSHAVGPFWYAAGASVPIFAFSIVAVNVKIRAPNAHTLLEIVRARWGDAAHKVFFFFAITTNIIVTSMLLLGGANVLNALTGMSSYAACMLIPIAVAIKTCWGGLQITYLSSLLSTSVILVVVLILSVLVFAHDDGGKLGSPGKMWMNLNAFAAAALPSVPTAEINRMQLGAIAGASARTQNKYL